MFFCDGMNSSKSVHKKLRNSRGKDCAGFNSAQFNKTKIVLCITFPQQILIKTTLCFISMPLRFESYPSLIMYFTLENAIRQLLVYFRDVPERLIYGEHKLITNIF